MLLVAILGVIFFVFVIYPAYRRYQVKRNVKKFEKSLVDLQHTLQQVLHQHKNTSSTE